MPLKGVILGQDRMVLTRMSSDSTVPKEYSYGQGWSLPTDVQINGQRQTDQRWTDLQQYPPHPHPEQFIGGGVVCIIMTSDYELLNFCYRFCTSINFSKATTNI